MRQPTVAQEVETAIAAIQAEVAEEADRTSHLNRESLRPLRKELVDLVREGLKLLKGDPAKQLEGLLVAFDRGFEKLEEAIAIHGQAAPKQQRYSPEARQASVVAHGKMNAIRRKSSERLGSSPLAVDVKERCGVGSNLNPEAPLDIYDAGLRMLGALRDPDNVELFRSRAFDAPLYVSQVEPLLTHLKKEIDEGVGPGPKKGEGTDLINQALLFLEVALSRICSLLEDHKAEALGERIRDRTPRKHYRRVTDRKPETPETPAEDDPQGG